MKRLLCLIPLLLFSIPQLSRAAGEEESAARSEVLNLAGAFTNDGFKMRDGAWFGKVSKGHPALIQVNLYNANGYWFAAASAKSAKGLKVSIFDDAGKPIAFEAYQDANKSAAGFSPDASGLYFIKVSAEDNDPLTFCLVYSFK